MALYPKAWRLVAAAIATFAFVLLLPAVGAAQGRGESLTDRVAQLEALVAQQGAVITALETALANEAAARAAADTTLQNSINGVGSSFATIAALNAEAAARAAADTTLQNNIDAEAAARQAADTTLQGNIDAEAAARAAADTTLQNNIDAEAAARQAADTTLQGNIDAEAAARAAADTTLQNNIDAEAAARAAADTTLQGNIDAEAAARAAADTTLQNNVDAETAARAAADTTLHTTIVDTEVGVITHSGVVQAPGTVFVGNGFTATKLNTGSYRIQFPAGTFVTVGGSGGLNHRAPVPAFTPDGPATVQSIGWFAGFDGSYVVDVLFSADTQFYFTITNSQ